ncbi:hypothetical protein DZB84_18375 [Bacillus sp. HNG]|uniref:hypothetical protein n=1 Tax=Bacillus sp. HNG TaxID=2293325 RepID=UPI000E2F21D1|nr:hypothetical protein [Bacillus sp. HNG]RFB12717.1 hypothetical protein DZB84_18375 [Bacillus sp. HNG]
MANLSSKELFYIISLFAVLFIVFFIGTIHTIKKFQVRSYYKRKVNRYYKNEQYSTTKISHLQKIYIKMDKTYTTYFNYIDIKAKAFMNYTLTKNDSNSEPEGFGYYKSDYLRIKGDALRQIKKIIWFKQSLYDAINYYNHQEENATKTMAIIKSESEKFGYEKNFKKIYNHRLSYLKSIELHCQKIKNSIFAEINKCDVEIRKHEQIKKSTLEDKIIDGSFAILTAPIRHSFNFAKGIINEDPQKVVKSGLMLGVGFLGIGAIAEAVDALEGMNLDALNSLEFSSEGLEFVDPHIRTLPDGSEIWIDGDGDTEVNLSKEEGGGYWRR